MLIILEDWLDFLAMLPFWLQLLSWIVSSYGWLAGWLCWLDSYAGILALYNPWLAMLPGHQYFLDGYAKCIIMLI
jgi:hypothetical protein